MSQLNIIVENERTKVSVTRSPMTSFTGML